jgi:tetratricopeptide (TPR) repeat protein
MAESHREEIAKLEALYAGNPGGRVFVHLAEAYRKAGEHERARRILDEGLSRHPDSASGYVVLGRVLADMQVGEEAEVAFRRVLELDSGNLVALRWLGDLARQGGRLDEAVTHYRDLLSRNPSNEEVRDLVEIVEREASGEARGAGPALENEPEAEWHEPEPAPQTPEEVPGEGLTPLSAAPGRTGDEETAEVEYGFVEIQAADDVREEEPGPAPDSAEAGESLVIDALAGSLDEAEQELGSLARTDEAEPLEIHLLDPSFAGEEAEEEDAGADYAGDEFIADLLSTPSPVQEQEALDASVDVLGTASGLTLQDGLPEQKVAPPDGDADAGFETVPGGDDQAEPPPLQPHGDELAAVAGESYADAAGEHGPEAAEPGPTDGEAERADVEAAATGPKGHLEHAEAGIGDRLLDRMDELAAEFADEPDADFAAMEPVSDPAEAPATEAAEPVSGGAAEAPTEEAFEPASAATEGLNAGQAMDPGLVTETMAELYRAQGFHDRAAEVYRALLKQRPFDLRLSAKLSEAEADAAAAGAERAAAASAGGQEEDASGDVWLRGVGAPWQVEPGPGPSDATPYAWTAEPDEQPGGEPISAYLKDLVSWKTSQQRWAEAPPRAPVEPPPSQTAPWSPEDEPWAATPGGAAWGGAQEAVPVESGESASAGMVPSPEAPADDARLGDGTPAMTEAASAAPDPSAPAAADAPATAEPATGNAADPWAPAGSGEASATSSDWTVEPAPGTGAEPVPHSGQAEPEPASDAEDEDLEMFRSWLQSLKK